MFHRDMLLRHTGFRIWERKHGREPVWKRKGKLYREHEAISLMLAEQQRRKKEKTPDAV